MSPQRGRLPRTSPAASLPPRARRERYHPLERALCAPKRLPVLLQYVSYDSAPIQVQAILLAQHLAARAPNLVAMLMPDYDDTEAVAVRQGYAQVRLDMHHVFAHVRCMCERKYRFVGIVLTMNAQRGLRPGPFC